MATLASDPSGPATAIQRLTPADRNILPTLLSKTHVFVKSYMSRYDSSHDFSHVLRVLHLALHIAQAEQKIDGAPAYDKTIVTLAALLHDVGDKKYVREGEENDEYAVKTFLLGSGASEQLSEVVQTIVNGVSYSKEVKDPQKVLLLIKEYPELAVVQDADRLDAIGAVGIGRTFTFAGAKGSGGPGMENVLKHFEEKLLRLGGMMKTKTGNEMAEKRLKILRDFERCWLEEKSMAGGVEIMME
ncbi:hypothetical protein TWF696_003796 [Orbilia brochopaga]|uniref:HD/PDEase domain-containing protein n=1 Tax=Orbilia brochopaga TaxID=3140254 RepID=A0AAV9V458_9PEZI